MKELADQFLQWTYQKEYGVDYVIASINELLREYLERTCIELDDDRMRSLEREVRHFLQVKLLHAWVSEHSIDKKG